MHLPDDHRETLAAGQQCLDQLRASIRELRLQTEHSREAIAEALDIVRQLSNGAMTIHQFAPKSPGE